ncbi:hypothetical protein, partial [Streptomyces fuscigenes]|uniref:hypothetical protein n=1 Tax=Streptomyces fuscigenes TaxID=1528880 RepID=UPI001F1AA27A
MPFASTRRYEAGGGFREAVPPVLPAAAVLPVLPAAALLPPLPAAVRAAGLRPCPPWRRPAAEAGPA